jgi:hypothetical protein
MRKDTAVVAALVGIRDGDAVFIEQHESWMRQTFIAALKSEKDPVWEVRTGIQFNPVAMGFVGTVLLLKNHFVLEDVRTLLEAAGDESAAAAHGFAHMAGVLAAMDERLPRCILRCALAACVQPGRNWSLSEVEAAGRERYHQRIRAAIEAELAWLNGTQDEPPFPLFPVERPHSRDRYVSFRHRTRERIEPPPEPDSRTHHHSAALWLSGAAALFDVAKRPWLRDIVKSYASWTRIMNGAEFEEDEELDSPPREWNMAYFRLLAYCLPGLTSEQIEEIALTPISETAERAFLEITTTFLGDVDAVYFNDRTLAQQQAVYVRTRLAQELMKGRLWKYYAADRATSTEIHLGPAVAVLLFNEYHSFGRPKCYLLANAIERVDPFLPILKELVESGTFLLTAHVLLNLLEVASRTTHLPLIVASCNAWLAAFGDDKSFWIDQDIGRRLCALLDAVLLLDVRLFASDQPLRGDVDRFLERLVRMGSAEAYRLEEKLRALP